MPLPGSRPKHQHVPAGPKQYTFSRLAKYLGCSHKRLRALCGQLGIELTPGKRNDRYPATGRLQRKVYKRHLRFLTHSEATRIILLHRERQGQRITAKALKEQACESSPDPSL